MLKLIQTDWGQFDLAFDDPAQQDADAAVATLIYAILFTDQEAIDAPNTRVSERFDRRGWYADPAAGSGLWHLRRQPLHSAARREALTMVRRALMRHAPVLTDLQVNERAMADAADKAGNVSSVSLEIAGRHNGRTFSIALPL